MPPADNPFQPIDAARLSDAVVAQIELLILQGVLRPGERLPGERDLAERLAVSRPSLREALAAMQADGLLVARPGSGVFVADVLGSAFSPALVRLIARHPQATDDYLAFRKDLEGLAAERAATAAGRPNLEVLDRIIQAMRHAHASPDPQAEAALDADFHMAIVEASHNLIALHMMRAMQDLLRQGMLFNRPRIFAAPELRDRLLDQHIAINDALQSRDGPAARAALEDHLDLVARTLSAQRRADDHDAVAALRLRNRPGP
ncbi:FadR family transcriptional regulator [Paracoccus aestuarii]|uniref:Pyruvate dehydrogenase complex repressor n=1 Tax=Paracoccus aestuarii TaxID=453842 RepID=A0A418ZTJ5_9RHOB|nr:FadR/GntR family transcriptional regulator [Paracoccus aestuarii]RJL01831.1 FadR family transcriptional regulator [Paracoccus aestuarii]WCQ98380.1 FadR family transcriptional regulator [Paracoccus aestuarii]